MYHLTFRIYMKTFEHRAILITLNLAARHCVYYSFYKKACKQDVQVCQACYDSRRLANRTKERYYTGGNTGLCLTPITRATGNITMMQQSQAAAHNGFDPVSYLQYNYSQEVGCLDDVWWTMDCLHRAFSEGDISGDLLIDVGSGPSLYQVLSGCEVFNKVLLTDLLEVNRQELKSWLQGGGSFNWTPYIQHVCKLEGRSPSEWTEKAARLREVVSDVLPIDVHCAQPMAPDALPSAGADCLVSCYCLESACPDLATFSKALGNMGKLLRPGGHLLLVGTLEATFYFAAPEVKIPIFPLNEAQLCASLQEQGYTLNRLEVYRVGPDMTVDTDDARGLFFVKAKKN